MLPNLTLVIQGLAFFAVAWLVMKFIWPHAEFGMTGAWFMAGMIDDGTDLPLGEFHLLEFGWAGPL